jgi:hypothetical protein
MAGKDETKVKKVSKKNKTKSSKVNVVKKKAPKKKTKSVEEVDVVDGSQDGENGENSASNRADNWVADELDLFINLVKEHHSILEGNFSAKLTHKTKDEKWGTITESLNR